MLLRLLRLKPVCWSIFCLSNGSTPRDEHSTKWEGRFSKIMGAISVLCKFNVKLKERVYWFGCFLNPLLQFPWLQRLCSCNLTLFDARFCFWSLLYLLLNSSCSSAAQILAVPSLKQRTTNSYSVQIESTHAFVTAKTHRKKKLDFKRWVGAKMLKFGLTSWTCGLVDVWIVICGYIV